MKSKKTLAILLAIMMILSSIPVFASAAEQITLTRDNITTWVTLSGKDGAEIPELYTGMKVGDMLEVHGGEVRYDANGDGTLADDEIVPGHFEFADANAILRPSAYETVNVNFIPDDSETYSNITSVRGGEYYRIAEQVLYVTPVVLEAPVATPVAAAGKNIRTSTISGGVLKNPVTGEVFTECSWSWVNRRTVVNESGYFQAQGIPSSGLGYNYAYVDVYIFVSGEGTASAIEEYPTINAVEYKENLTAADLTLTGGKTAVPGTFAITDTKTLSVGDNSVYVTFTPDDTSMVPYQFSVTVTVNPGKFAFTDENGAEIVPEITVPYGTEFGDRTSGAGSILRPYLKVDSVSYSISFFDGEGNAIDSATRVPVGTNEYKVKITTSNKNYETTELTCKLTVEPTDVKVYVKAIVGTIQVTKANLNDPTPTGTFAIYVDGVLLKEGVKHNETVEWNPTVSKTYEIKAVYTPAENDPVNVEDVTISAERKLERKITYGELILNGNPSYLCGDTVTLSANMADENFETWVITDANGNAVDLGIDLTASSISFTMPDHDLNIEVKSKSTSGGNSGLELPDLGDLELPEFELDAEGDHKFKFVNIIQNLIEMLKNFIKQIGQTIEGIL